MKKVKSGVFQRGFALAKLTLKSGTLAATSMISSDKEEHIVQQMKLLSKELGLLKGSIMKVGQTISMYGEHFLPPKANEYLKNLQFNSPPIEWSGIKKFLIEEIGAEKLSELDIERKATAAASLGQVHKARHKKTGAILAVKIQYPGVESAIKSDLKAIKAILSLSKILPGGLQTDQFFEEIETMLIQETNYKLERTWTEQMYDKLKAFPEYVVPQVQARYCSKHVLTTSFESGVPIDSAEAQALSQERRNALALKYLDLYFKELFEFKLVQTDPHLGNYRIRISENPQNEPDKLVLYDFGAMREVPDHFGLPFKNLVQGAADQNKEMILESAFKLGYLNPDDDAELKERYIKVCSLIGEPFAENPKYPFTDKDGNYDWKKTDLPKRVSEAAKEIFKFHKLRVPPRESVFLDRKLAGAFFLVSVLGLNGKAKDVLQKYY